MLDFPSFFVNNSNTNLNVNKNYIDEFVETNKINEQYLLSQIYAWMQYRFYEIDFHISRITAYQIVLDTYLSQLKIVLNEIIVKAKSKVNINDLDDNNNTCDRLLFLIFFSDAVIDLYNKNYNKYIESLTKYKSDVSNYITLIKEHKNDILNFLSRLIT